VLEIPDRVAQRAASAFQEAADGCHISTYSRGSHQYAQIGWHDENGRRSATTAHRAVWVSVHGQIPKGMTVDHTCKKRACVRAEHLRLLSNFENARRTSGRDWPLGTCINGHSNSELYTEPSGRVRCRPCKRSTQQRSNQRRRAA
jgi:hypothetical protein